MGIGNATIEKDEELHKELIRLAKRSKSKRKIVFFIISFLIVLLLVCGACMVGNNLGKRKAMAEIEELKAQIEEQQKTIQEMINTPIVVNPVSPEINLEIIYSEIKNIGELATTEYLFTDAAEFSDSRQIKNWNIPLTEKSFILKWNGVIKAGIDVNQVIIEVDKSGKKIFVSIPSASILSNEVDNDSVELLDEKNNIFNRISVDDKIDFDASTEEAIKNRAIENGILEKAQKNAEYILTRLIQSDPAVSSNYTIEFSVIQ